MKRLITFITVWMVAMSASGQFLEVGFFAGGSYYTGDLNPSYHFMGTHPAYGVVARYPYGTRWAFKVSGYFGRVSADVNKSGYIDNRDLNFESKIMDISAVAEFNFFDYFTGSKRDVISPYIFGGVGFFTFNPESNGVELNSLGTEGQNIGFDGRSPYNLYSFCLPFGFGLKYSLNSRLSLGVEWGMRKTLTDYLDDVSTTYYLNGETIDPSNVAESLSDPSRIHKPNQERGNPATRDWYNFSGVTLTYKFRLPGSRKCPDQG